MPHLPFRQWLGDDNDSCLPVLDQEGIARVLLKVDSRVRAVLGNGPNPSITPRDLEQIQVTNYARLGGVSPSQAPAAQADHRFRRRQKKPCHGGACRSEHGQSEDDPKHPSAAGGAAWNVEKWNLGV